MASIIPGYEYDIFISYRQKDNKGDKWVSEFVKALKDELESTFKEAISVYFDINSHDGLLETYDVGASLKEKLKCLVFIPIISQTYCDPKSFAWQNEFCAFNRISNEDRFGRDIRLGSGNVASRILPVKIHDLDEEDKSVLYLELGGVLRAIEFIYKEPGVNRPLKVTDNKNDNLNKTDYRNQVNKVANAVKELAIALKNFDTEKKELDSKIHPSKNPLEADRTKSYKFKAAIWSLIIAGFIVSGYIILHSLFKTSSERTDRSIAVLPFHNMSNDPEQEYFSNGMTEEILNQLFKIEGIKIPSGTSSVRYKGSNFSIREISRELGVSYVLEGSVSRAGDKVRIIVRLINGKNEQLLWTEDYKRAMSAINLLEIQSDVAQQVAENMKVAINPEVRKRIEAKATTNTEAYTLFLQAWTEFLPFDQAKSKLERAIVLDPEFAEAYALLAYYWLHEGGYGGNLVRDQVLEKVEPLIEKALQLDKNSIVAHTTRAILRLYYYWDFISVEKEIEIFKQLNPSNSSLEYFVTDYLLASGQYSEALKFAEDELKHNKKVDNWIDLSQAYYYNSQPEKALETIETAEQLYPNSEWILITKIKLLDWDGKYNESFTLFEKSGQEQDLNNFIPIWLGHLSIACFKADRKDKARIYLNELIKRSRNSTSGSPSFFLAAVYITMGEKDMAISTLERAYADHEVEMYWLNVDPFFKPLHGDPQFENILRKIGFE